MAHPTLTLKFNTPIADVANWPREVGVWCTSEGFANSLAVVAAHRLGNGLVLILEPPDPVDVAPKVLS